MGMKVSGMHLIEECRDTCEEYSEYLGKTYVWVWFQTLLDLDQLSMTNIATAFGLRLTALTLFKRENYGILHLGSGPLPTNECGLKDS